MGLLSARRSDPDSRAREYVVTGLPLVAADDLVVNVDLVVRFAPSPPRPEEAGLPATVRTPDWVPDDERAIRAVVITTLRLLAETLRSEELLTGRAAVSAAVDRALAFAPVAPRFDAATTLVEAALRPDDRRWDDEFRVVRP
jgi:regulator of protease activity HflC (stomatin/prohibitin superfamily)